MGAQMRTILTGSSPRVFLTPDEFNAWKDGAEEESTKNMIRLGGQSFRRGELEEVQRRDFYKAGGLVWCHLESKNTKDDDYKKRREVWIPEELWDNIRIYMIRNGIEEDDYLFDIGAEQIGNRMKAAAQNAAIATGNEGFEDVTSHDARRFFATHYLFRVGLSPQVVRELGGWTSLTSMKSYLSLPQDVMSAEIAAAGLLDSNPQKMPATAPQNEIEKSISILEGLTGTDATDVPQKRVADLLEDVDGVTVALDEEPDGKSKDNDDDEDDDNQYSINRFNGSRRSDDHANSAV